MVKWVLLNLGFEANILKMENGVNKPVVDAFVDEKVEEKVMVSSDEPKDVEDVFEEAVDTPDHLNDEGTKDESGDDASVGDLGSVVVDGGSNVGGEMDSFDETEGIPSEGGNDVVGEGEGKVGDLAGAESVIEVVVPDKVDERGTKRGETSGELNERLGVSELGAGVENEIQKDRVGKPENGDSGHVIVEESVVDAKLENGTDRGKESIIEVVYPDNVDEGGTNKGLTSGELNDATEIYEVGAGVESEILKDGAKKPENRDFGRVNVEESVVDAKLENGIDGMVGNNGEIKASGEVLPEDGDSGGLKENESGTEYQDNGAAELTDASAITRTELLEDKGEELNDKLVRMNAELQKNESQEVKDAISGLGSGLGNVVSEEASDSSAKFETQHEIKRNGDIKDTAAGVDSKHHEETCEVEGTSTDIHEEVVEGTVAPEIGSSHSLDRPTNQISEKIQAGTMNSSSETQPQQAGEIVCDVHVVAEQAEEKVEMDQEKKRSSTQVTGECNVQPSPQPASSAAKSTTPVNPPARPAGLGRAAPLLEPAPRVVQHPRVNGAISHTQTQPIEDPGNGEAEEYDETREKLQMIRVKFLRLAHRLGQTPHNVVVAQVLYRLGLAEQLRGRNGGRVGAFSFDRASAMAEQLEAAGQEPLDFSCTIMVLGKTGVGKSATINSIFDEVKFGTDAFQMGTKKVQDVVGTVQGIKVRVIDTPGLLPSWSDQRQNEKILHSVKRFIKKTPPDIVLYLDRLDMQNRDFSDMPLLRTITDIFGPSIWFNAIVVLTHAASAPPDGPNGTASSYDMFVTQRSHVVQQAIRQAAGDMRLMNPVSLVENHSACRTNRAGQRVLPNGQVWKPHLLLLSFASKILAEANTLLKLQDTPPGKPFSARSRAPPLPFLLSSLLQSRPQVKLPEEQFGDEDSLDDDLDDSSESEDESEFDELPPFKRLTKAQVAKLTKAQKRAYFDELEYREKLFMKKQLKEEKKRRKMMKKMAAAAKDLPSDNSENVEEESGGAASVPVPMPDLALPASFDSDNPTHRYRYLDSSNQWLVRPVLETHGWDHDVGYEGINAERLFVVKNKIPVSFSGQVTKDKKDANVQMEVVSSLKHGEGKATSLGFDMQTVGKDLAYTLRSETRFSNFRKNKAMAGLSVTHLGDSLSAGVKVEDKLIVNKRFRVVMTGGAMTSRSDVAYGGSLEAQLRDADYPLGRSLTTLGLSVMDWHGDLAIGCNIQSQVPIGRSTNMIGRANLNNRGAGQVSIRVNSSEQLQLALIGLIPLLKKLLGYSQQMQLGQ